HWINKKYTTRATGWDTQVGFQPGLQLGYRHSLLAGRARVGSKAFFDLAPTTGVAVGTVRSSADIGGRARLGYNLSHPWDARAWRVRTPLEYWVSAEGRAEYVARDFSLDGSVLDDGRNVARVPGVRAYSFGVGLRLHRLLLQWEAITKSREYETGPARHTFSTMSAGWEFYR
ncbi:MAG: lipid A-modifier LpxR family protein, partial [Gemmatimonadaceae bacterium]